MTLIIDLEMMVHLYESGLSADQVAKTLKIGTSTVLRHLKAYGTKIRSMGRKGIKRVPRSDITKERISTANKGKTRSDATRAIMSANNSGPNNPRFGKVPAHGKGSWYESARNGPIWMRSTYELRFCQMADDLCYSYEWEPKAFPLDVKGKKTTYRPDAFIKDLNIWIEIKGYWREDAKDKFNAFKEQYPNERIVVITIDDLELFEEDGVLLWSI